MATLYLKTSGGNWNTANTWSNVNASGVDNSGPPTAADNCIAELLSGNVTIDSGSVCRGFDTTSGTSNWGGTITWNAITFNIGDGTAAAGNIPFKLNSGVTVTLSNAATSAVSFISTSGTAQTITTAGKTLGNVTINGAGSSYTLGDNLTSSGSWTYTAGTTLDTSTNSAIITLSGTNRTFDGGGKTYFRADLTGAGTATVSSVNTFTTFKRIGTATVTDVAIFTANQTFTSAYTLQGNSAVNRLLVRSSVLGTARSFTNSGATATVDAVDFRDITFNTAVNFSAAASYSGNCGGNSGITFTTAQTNYYQTAVNDNWSTTAKWFLATNGAGGAGRVPIPQDTAVFDVNSVTASGKTITCDIAYMPFSTTWSGVANAPNFTTSSSTATLYGSLVLTSGMGTFTQNANLAVNGRLANSTITSGGKSFTNMSINVSGFTISQGDALTVSGFWNNSGATGTWDTAGFNLTVATAGGNSANLTLNASTLTLTSSGTVWAQPTGTVSAGTSTISFTDTSSSDKTFVAGSKTYYNCSITGGGSGKIIFTMAATWNQFPQVTGGTKSLTYPSATTTTFTNGTNLGNSTNLITIIASTAASATTWAVTNGAAGIVNCDYLSLKDNTASGPTPFYAGANSTLVSGTTGWNATAAPAGIPRMMLMGVN